MLSQVWAVLMIRGLYLHSIQRKSEKSDNLSAKQLVDGSAAFIGMRAMGAL